LLALLCHSVAILEKLPDSGSNGDPRAFVRLDLEQIYPTVREAEFNVGEPFFQGDSVDTKSVAETLKKAVLQLVVDRIDFPFIAATTQIPCFGSELGRTYARNWKVSLHNPGCEVRLVLGFFEEETRAMSLAHVDFASAMRDVKLFIFQRKVPTLRAVDFRIGDRVVSEKIPNHEIRNDIVVSRVI
jgi:hypothetical protein